MAKRTPRTEANDEGTIRDTPPARPAKASSRRRASEPFPDSTRDSIPDSIGDPPDATPSETRRTESTGPMSTGPSEEDIRMRAYLRYVERGGGYGFEFDDWVEAERELKRQK